MIETRINGRWTLKLPPHRAARPEWATGWEPERIASMFDHLGEGGHVVYDVGSEEGDMPALWASWGNRVALFEPNPRVWPNPRAIFDANGLTPLATFDGFAGDTDDINWPCNLYLNAWPPSADGALIGDHGFCNLWERPDLSRVSINTVARYIDPPTAITIDVEGAELRVLLGASDVLTRDRPHVWVSVHPDFMHEGYDDDPHDLHRYMRAHGYVGEHLATDHEEHWRYRPT